MDVLRDIFTQPPVVDRDERRGAIRSHLLASSRFIQSPNFLRCSDSDLRLLLDQYDALFFGRAITRAVPALPLRFSGRLRSAGGRTLRTRSPAGVAFAIEVSSSILFENFDAPGDSATVVGLHCADRVDALMRIMEHELIHLAEFLAFGRSACGRRRFQECASRLFGHTAHRHAMITPRQRVIRSTSLRPGDRVRFTMEGTQLRGVINRITQRATVLVPDARGRRYSDGRRYLKFYVPVHALAGEAL